MMLDMRATIKTKSDQLNADEVLQPMTITVTGVRLLQGDQPVAIHYEGDNGKPYKPCLTMRKLLVKAWGEDGSLWAGRSMTLFCDPDVKFGNQNVGGIRISHLSHIKSGFEAAFNVTRGKKKAYRVDKLEIAIPAVDAASVYQQLAQFAQRGMLPLRQAWASLSDAERAAFGNTCPDDLKQIAEQADVIAQQMQDEPRG